MRELTVLIQTSPIPSHPSTALLEALFRSFDRHVEDIRRLAQIYILCDGYEEVDDCNEGGDPASGDTKGKDGTKRGRVTKDLARRYRQHLQQLRDKLDRPPFAAAVPEGGDSRSQSHASCTVEMIELPERHGSARAIKAAFDRGLVTTPFVMVAQHDNFFVSDVPLPSILGTMMDNEWIKCLHFISTATMDYVKKTERRYSIDLEPFVRRNVGDLTGSLVPLVFWYGRTAISRTDYYTDFVLKGRTLRAGDHLEELLGVEQLRDVQTRGMDVAHPAWGNFVLDARGSREVMYHLSGRRVRAVDPTSRANNDHADARSTTGTCACTCSVDIGSTDAALPGGGQAPTDEACGSFTTARTVRAIVPGLEIIPSEKLLDLDKPTAYAAGRFKQKCFHCGKKGHSYRFCPDAAAAKDGDRPVEIIGL